MNNAGRNKGGIIVSFFCLSRGLIANKVKKFDEFYICQSSLSFVFKSYINEFGYFSFIQKYFELFFYATNQSDYLFNTNINRRKMRYPRLQNKKWIHLFFLKAKRAELFFYEQYFEKEIIHSECKIVLIWNGSASPASILEKCAIKLGKQCFYWELGYFPKTVQVDSNGVNFKNSLPSNPQFFKDHKAEILKLEKPKTLGVRTSKKKLGGQIQLPKQYFFVPFQVPSDSQILDYSPWINGMVELYENLLEVVNELDDVVFVLKEHPSYKISIIDQVESHPRILFANNNVTQDLIESARGVITINSTVGIEALVCNKPVITLGSACYNIEGVATHCENLSQLLECVKNFCQINHDEELIDLVLRYIYEILLLPMDIKEEGLSSKQYEFLCCRLNQEDQHSELCNKS